MSALISKLQESVLALLLITLVSCSRLAQMGIGITDVQDVKQQWQHDSTVYIQGAVSNQVQLLESWAYQVQDKTGAIWVLTKQPVPARANHVLLKGRVRYQAITTDSQDLKEAYIVEEVRLKIEPGAQVTSQPKIHP
ncbi:MAG TPA: hypothetical protein V6D03_04025 [Candidatus Caenarcaniphilales bacterium]